MKENSAGVGDINGQAEETRGAMASTILNLTIDSSGRSIEEPS